jgi:NADH-quinone oxidoreductase subunit G
VHSLISGNLMDVCPVGAITTRDYRFKSRPWDNPNAADTICTLCAKGCNITPGSRPSRVGEGVAADSLHAALQPEVNGYWMCDIGRFEYHWIESDDRLRRPLVRNEQGVQEPAAWSDAMAKSAIESPRPGWRMPKAYASWCRRMRRTKSSSCFTA